MTAHYTESEFLAKRARETTARAPAALIVLPGALRAIPHDELLAHQANRKSACEITALVNAKWRSDNEGTLSQYDTFVQSYNAHKRSLEREAERAAAEELRKRTVLEALLKEHDARIT